MLLINELLL